jgi:hypothetical protein
MTTTGNGGGLRPVVWSAATCDFKSAGVYIGLAPEYEHLAVARGLSAKQLHMFVGGRMRSTGEARPWAIHYYAVRDPSAVRVVPVGKPALPNGFKPVHLRFKFPEQNGRSTVVVSAAGGVSEEEITTMAAAAPSGFVMTIGLAAEKERDFFVRIIEAHLDQDWGEVFQRVHDYGCKGAA